MDPALAGYFIGTMLGYGLISRLLVWIFARKDRSRRRIVYIHLFTMFGWLMLPYVARGELYEWATYIPSALIWFAFDYWRAGLSHTKASTSSQ